MSTYDEYKGIFCIFFPMICKWLLPVGMEKLLYVYLFGCFPFFLPNVFLVLSLFYLKRKSSNILLSVLLIFDFLVGIISLFINSEENFIPILLGGSFYIPAFWLAVNYEFYDNSKIFLWVFIPLVFLTVQILLFSLGIFKLQADHIDEFAGVFRIYTTAGASTGASAIVVILGIVCFYTAKTELLRMISLTLALIGSALLMARMPFAGLLCFLLFVFFTRYAKNKKKALLVISVIGLLGYIGVFNPLIQRMEMKSDFSSGRDRLISRSYEDFKDNELLGLGIGNIYATNELQYSGVKPRFNGAPHNSYVLIFFEQGYLGALLFLLILLLLIAECWKYDKHLACVLFIILLTIYNSETVVLTNSEYIFLFAVLIMIARKEKGGIIKRGTNEK